MSNLTQEVVKVLKDTIKPLLDETDQEIILEIKRPLELVKKTVDILYAQMTRLNINSDREEWADIMERLAQSLYLIRAYVTQVPMELWRNIRINDNLRAEYTVMDQFTWLKLVKANINDGIIQILNNVKNINALDIRKRELSIGATTAWTSLLNETMVKEQFTYKDSPSASGFWARPIPHYGVPWLNFKASRQMDINNRLEDIRQSIWNDNIYAAINANSKAENDSKNYHLYYYKNNKYIFYNTGWLFEWYIDYINNPIHMKNLNNFNKMRIKPLLYDIIQPTDQYLALSRGDISITDANGKILKAIQVKQENEQLITFRQIILWLGGLKQLINRTTTAREISNFFESNSTTALLDKTVLKNDNCPEISNQLNELINILSYNKKKKVEN